MSKWLRLLPFALAIVSLHFVGCGDDPATPAAACGNGAIDPGEACDDGNKIDGDGCSALCQKEVSLTCGNGKVAQGEACDDGNKVDGDGCQNDCTKTPPKEIVCQPLPAGPCTVTAGDDGRVLTGAVLTPDVIYRGGQVVVNATGSILQVGCKADCAADPACKAAATRAGRSISSRGRMTLTLSATSSRRPAPTTTPTCVRGSDGCLPAEPRP